MSNAKLKLLSKPIKEAAERFAFRHTNFGAPTYPYNIERVQLALLINEIERLKDINGNIVEIGVARGMTTRFLCQHVVDERIEDTLTLYAIDTYTSFVREDLDFEIKQRRKSLSELAAFAYNDYDTQKKNFSKYSFAKPIKADCSTVVYTQMAPIKLAFLDVDLYLPTKNTLPKLFDSLI